MSPKEALLFAEYCSYLVVIENQINPCFFIDTYGSHAGRFVKREFNQQERLLLAEMGLVNFEEDIFFSFEHRKPYNIIYGNKKISITYYGDEQRGAPKEIKTIISGYPLTQSGKELFAVCAPDFHNEFWKNIQTVLTLLKFQINEII